MWTSARLIFVSTSYSFSIIQVAAVCTLQVVLIYTYICVSVCWAFCVLCVLVCVLCVFVKTSVNLIPCAYHKQQGAASTKEPRFNKFGSILSLSKKKKTDLDDHTFIQRTKVTKRSWGIWTKFERGGE